MKVNGRRYMKLNQIGRGGSSKVRTQDAHDHLDLTLTLTNRQVYRVVSPNWTTYALKYVPLKNADTVTEESYLNEISLLKKLNHHDNIIRLVDSEVRSGSRPKILWAVDESLTPAPFHQEASFFSWNMLN